jgi:hypothetical protein
MPNSSESLPSLCASLLLVGALILSAGCGPGSGQGLDENGNLIGTDTGTGGGGGGGSGGGASGNPNATLAWVQTNVFGGVCSQCHTGAGSPLGVNWSSETNTCSNVGRSSGEIPTMLEIESGNPDASYVIWKVEGIGPSGDPIVGEQMPLSNPALTADTIQNIRDWISDGTPGCQGTRATGAEDTAARSDLSASADSLGDQDYTLGSWKDVWNESLQICTLCHSTTPSSPRCSTDFACPPGGLVLSADNYTGVVDGRIVVPFDPAGSVLWQRITASDPETRMPLGFAPLTQTQLDIIRHWIEDGARFCPENQVCQ